MTGDAAGALAHALEGVQACEGLGRPEWIYALAPLGLAQLRTGDVARARQTADCCAEWIARDTPIAYYNICAYSAVAEIYLSLLGADPAADDAAMREAVRSAAKQVYAIGRIMPAAAPRAELWRAIEAARLRGDHGRAAKHFRRSMAAARRLAMPYDEAAALASMFEHVPMPRDDGRAQRDRAADLFESIGALHDAERHPTPRRPPGMSTPKPVKVAIIGGGCAGMTSAFELTRPEHAGRYEVTVYQPGWRLGGKGASSRGAADRIEEHGLHLWMGYYDNAFRLMRECYEELARDPAFESGRRMAGRIFARRHGGRGLPHLGGRLGAVGGEAAAHARPARRPRSRAGDAHA